jgi:hypothetical protein
MLRFARIPASSFCLLRPSNTGLESAADHITVLDASLAHVPE